MDLMEQKARQLFSEYRHRLIEKKQPSNIKWTYVIFDAETNLYKIGISSNPLRRAKECKAFRPYSCLFILHVDNLEHELHQLYRDKSFGGEWFKLTEDDINDLICDMGFRYMYGLLGKVDVFEKSPLYVVQREELKAAKLHSCRYDQHSECQDFYKLYQEIMVVTKTVKEANARGMRTPSGFPWRVEFARNVVNHIKQINEEGGER